MFNIATAPFAHNRKQTRTLMLLVILACVPGLLAQTWFFGWGTFIQILLALVTALACEALVLKLRGRAIFPKVILALFTGMRRGEIAALRWRNVDLAGKMISVRESIEETKAHGPRFKSTKTKKGLRDITMPDIVAETLSEHRRGQLEERLSLGLGKPPADALVFPSRDGGPQYPRNLSGEWKEACAIVGIEPPVTFHALRHTHASQLIKAKVDVVTVSRRLGHANPQITLQVYSHLWDKRDDEASAVINAAIGALNVTRS